MRFAIRITPAGTIQKKNDRRNSKLIYVVYLNVKLAKKYY